VWTLDSQREHTDWRAWIPDVAGIQDGVFVLRGDRWGGRAVHSCTFPLSLVVRWAPQLHMFPRALLSNFPFCFSQLREIHGAAGKLSISCCPSLSLFPYNPSFPAGTACQSANAARGCSARRASAVAGCGGPAGGVPLLLLHGGLGGRSVRRGGVAA